MKLQSDEERVVSVAPAAPGWRVLVAMHYIIDGVGVDKLKEFPIAAWIGIQVTNKEGESLDSVEPGFAYYWEHHGLARPSDIHGCDEWLGIMDPSEHLNHDRRQEILTGFRQRREGKKG